MHFLSRPAEKYTRLLISDTLLNYLTRYAHFCDAYRMIKCISWGKSWCENLLILPRGSLYIMMSILPRLTRCTESISSPSWRIWCPGKWWWRCMVFDKAFKQLSSKSWKRNECERTVRCMWRWISYWRPSGNFLRTCNEINHWSSRLQEAS